MQELLLDLSLIPASTCPYLPTGIKQVILPKAGDPSETGIRKLKDFLKFKKGKPIKRSNDYEQ